MTAIIKKSILFLLLILAVKLQASDFPASGTYFGIYGGINNVYNNTELPVFPTSPECGEFNKGQGRGFLVGLSAGYKIFGPYLTISGRLYYESRPASLDAETQCSEILDPVSNDYVSFVRGHSYEADLQYVVLDIGLEFKPVESIPLSIRAAFDLGNPIIGAKYTNNERIISPNVQYPGGVGSRLVGDGELNQAGTAIGTSIALQGVFPLDFGLTLVPEISYRKGLNSVLSDIDWRSDILRLGLSVLIDIGPRDKKDPVIIEEPEQEPEPVQDTVILVDIPEPDPEPVKDTVEIADISIPEPKPEIDLIKEFSVPDFKVKETIVTQTYPILPYIFFDSSSSRIRSRYYNTEARDGFSEDALPKNTLGIYYNTLDIIGRRMSRKMGSKVVITGTTDGAEEHDIDNRLTLAQSRAEAVRDYLSGRWDIYKDRFIIKAVDLPALATNDEYDEGFEENRRVEISSEDHELLQPVIHSKFEEFNIDYDPDKLQYSFNEPASVKESRLSYYSSGELLYENDIDIYSTEMNGAKVLEEEIMTNLDKNQDISATLSVVNEDGIADMVSRSIVVEKSLEKYELGRLNLIVFDFDKSKISAVNKLMIRKFIQNSIKDNSIITIVGSTDRLGEKDYNKRLSVNRAKNTRDYIKQLEPKARIVEVKGLGDSNLRYDNDIPEGRFYSRTVLIEVKTPIDD